jgi:hypothetical protein
VYFVLHVEVVRSLNLNLYKKRFEFIKDFKNGKLTLSGLRGKGLTQPRIRDKAKASPMWSFCHIRP